MSIKSTGPPICQPAYRTPLLKRRIIDECIDDMLNHIAMVYLDDIVIYSNNMDEHINHIRLVFD